MAPSTTTTFWSAFERVRGLQAVPAIWRHVLRADFESFSRYIRPIQEVASVYPCLQPGSCGFPHRVIHHSPEDIVAVSEASDGECEELVLRHEDLIIHELSLSRLGRDLAATSKLQAASSQFELMQTRVIGSVLTDRGSLPVTFGIYADEQALMVQSQRLRAAMPIGPILLLVPSGRLLTQITRERLSALGFQPVPLEGLCSIGSGGFLESKTSLEHFLEISQPMGPKNLLSIQNQPVTSKANRFQKKGEAWEVCFQGRTFFLKATGGIPYLRLLLEQPGDELSTIDMVARVDRLEAIPIPEDMGEVLDARGRKSVKAEIGKVREKLQEAEDFGFSGEAETLKSELSSLLEVWKGATGKGGKPRKSGSTGEQFRKRVGIALSRTIDEIRQHDPQLAAHFNQFITKGTFCRYNPDPPIEWEL